MADPQNRGKRRSPAKCNTAAHPRYRKPAGDLAVLKALDELDGERKHNE